MPKILGIDTSNYTTSLAVYDAQDGSIRQQKKLLPVAKGQLGLRQSDAVFHHTVQLPQLFEQLSAAVPLTDVQAVGVSVSPRTQEGSYMPCFLAGVSAAQTFCAASGAALHRFSHQQGHIAAALYSANRLDLIGQRFLAFHVSGGTTDALLVEPDENDLLRITLAASSLDLKAGQAVDRCGVMLGLDFPAGQALDELASRCEDSFRIRPVLKGANCSLSGIENKCRAMLTVGESPERIAKFCIQSICAALDKMAETLLAQYGELPLLFSGGVMSNSLISRELTQKYGAYFAQPAFSCDNAAGVAVLAALREGIIRV